MPDELRQFQASIFQALAHPTRIAMLDALRNGELSAGAIIKQLHIEQANASQHLAVLRSKDIVTNRREGNQVFYSLRDPMLIEAIDIMRHYYQAHMAEAISMLNHTSRDERPGDGRENAREGSGVAQGSRGMRRR